MTVTKNISLKEYQDYSKRVVAKLIQKGNKGSFPREVAETIFKAATDEKNKMRYPVGKMKTIIIMKKLLSLGIYQRLVRGILEE